MVEQMGIAIRGKGIIEIEDDGEAIVKGWVAAGIIKRRSFERSDRKFDDQLL